MLPLIALLPAFLSGTKIRCLVANCSRRCRGSSDIIPTRMAVREGYWNNAQGHLFAELLTVRLDTTLHG